MKRFLALSLLLSFALAPAASRGAINALDAVPAATLLLPHFEVDLSGSADPGPITVLRLGNASPSPVLAHMTLWTDQGVPTRAVDLYLGGYDVVPVDLRLLLLGVVPQRATNPWTGNVGGSSTGPTAFPDCPASWPEGGRLSAADAAGLRAAHTGQPSPILTGLCGGKAWGDGIARGYVTIDVVNRCSTATTFPGAAGYFAEGGTGIASNRNVLFGDYSVIDRRNNADVSDTLVHVEASRNAAERTALGDYTFYGRLSGVNGTGIDNREALHAQWLFRYVNGGTIDAGTRAVVWRDPGPRSAFACASPPALGTGQIAAFDEEESPAAIGGIGFPLASEAVALADPARIAIPFSFGFLVADLSRTAPLAPFGTRNQSWVGIRFLATGRFAMGYGAVPLTHVRETPTSLPVGDPPTCADGIDNDGDGRIDYPADPGCRDVTWTENPPCDDGNDNDADGLIDLADPGCTVAWWYFEDFPPPQCLDTLDNDGDGKIDYPADLGCSHPYDATEAPDPVCSDGVDNDGDGKTDYPADPGCSSPSDGSEAPEPACADGADNDGDGATDYPADLGCASARGTKEDPQCSDLVDNDGDGATNYPADPGCSSPADDSEDTPECADGKDNDGDGLIDYPSDPGCSAVNDTTEAPKPECADGIDNDGNGSIDFPNDPGCAEVRDAREIPDCSDGQFGDYPGNPGCASPTDQNEKPGTTTRQCSDGVDNDGDGLVDYPADPGCISRYDDNEFSPS